MRTTHNHIQYLGSSPLDEKWGLTVTTVGYQRIPAHSTYPSAKQHPQGYVFNPQNGRTLSEYQLVYISEGSGFFESASCKKQKIKAGTMLLIFPDEWHTYYPEENGWYEHWVGFRGNMIENWIANKFFLKEKPVFEIGISSTIIGLYEDMDAYASKEDAGYQQLISSIVLYLMGEIYFKVKNSAFKESTTVRKINEAKTIMKRNISQPISAESIAKQLNVSYSWLRSRFKAYTGISPTQYHLNLRYLKAKEMLCTTQLSISDIAFALNFETVSQFSSFFTKKEGMSPSTFKKKYLDNNPEKNPAKGLDED